MAEVEDPSFKYWLEEQAREYMESQRGLTEAKPVIEETAQTILESGKAYGYLCDTWQSLHIGDSHVGKCLISTIPQSSILNSKGVHVSIAGEGGRGKSDCLHKALALIPSDHKFAGDLTPKALFYQNDAICAGMIIAIDDIVWTDPFGHTVKKITDHFQEKTPNATVQNGEGACGEAPELLTFWCTQVDMQTDEQLRDRFILVEVDNSPEHNAEVISFMKRQASGTIPTGIDLKERIGICQDIVRLILDQDPFNVVVPFAERIAFTGDPRAWRMFEDIIKAFAVFRYPIREVDERGRLVATVEDFEDAAELYRAMGGIDRDKFTKKERKILESIKARSGAATVKEISADTGINDQYIRDLLWGKGKDSQQKHGLNAKCNGKLSYGGGWPKKVQLEPSFEIGYYAVYLEEA